MSVLVFFVLFFSFVLRERKSKVNFETCFPWSLRITRQDHTLKTKRERYTKKVKLLMGSRCSFN